MKGVAVQEVTNVDSAPGRPWLRCGKRSLRGPRAQSTAGRDSPRWHHGAPFPCKERAAFFSAQRLLLTGSPALQQFDCCVQRKQHQSIKHGPARGAFCQQLIQWEAHLKTAGQQSKTKATEPGLLCHLAHPGTSLHSASELAREGQSFLFAN